MFCLNDFFFDIVFDLMINNDTYDFTDCLLCQGEYKDKTGKYIYKSLFIGVNGFILLGCIYVLIFILIPIIKFRILQCSRKRKSNRYTDINERLGSISLLKERLNSDIL